jgi:hypothetical protein
MIGSEFLNNTEHNHSFWSQEGQAKQCHYAPAHRTSCAMHYSLAKTLPAQITHNFESKTASANLSTKFR